MRSVLSSSERIAAYAATGGAAPAILAPPLQPGPFSANRFRGLLDAVRERLLAVGMNPGGPLPLLMEYQPRRGGPAVRWTDLIDWGAQPRGYRSNPQPIERVLMADI